MTGRMGFGVFLDQPFLIGFSMRMGIGGLRAGPISR